MSDTIFYYTKSDKYTFNVQYSKYDEKYVNDFYRYVDENGRRYRLGDLRSPNPRPNLTYDYKGYKPHPNGWAMTREKMEKLDNEGRLHFPQKADGRIQLKRFLDEMSGVRVANVWDDIPPVQSQAAERRGYPTQKPLALLERIIAVSSNEGDIVLDPFCGCGTAVIQSARMKRRWIGIDITYLAIAEIMYRLDSETDNKLGEDYQIQGIPTDDHSARAFFHATAKQNHKPFEMWAVSLTGAHPIEKKGGDRGIDGRLPIYDPDKNLRWAMVQVKGGALTVSQVRDFAHVVEREKAVFGMFLSLEEPTKQMRKEAEELGYLEGYGTRKIPRLQLRTLKELLEEKHEFEIPSGYQPIRDQGVGKAKIVQTELALQ